MGAAVALIALASVTAAALVLERPRAKAWAVLAVAALLPVALVVQRWGLADGRWLRDHPAVLAGGVLAVAAAVAALALLVARRPGALPVLAVGVLPFRLPVAGPVGPEALALAVHVVVLAGAVAYAAVRLRPVRSLDDELLTRPDPPTRGLEWALAAGLVLYAAQATGAPGPDAAAGTLVTALVPFALLFVLLRRADWTPRLVRTCAATFVGVAVVLVAVAVGEAATARLLPAPRVVTDDRLADAFRASSLLFDPDALGRVLAVAALVVTAGLLWARRGRDLALAGVVLVVLGGGLALTRSSGAAVALLAGLVVLAALRWGPRAAAGLAAGLVVAGLAAVLLAPGPLRLDRDPVAAADQVTSARSAPVRDGAALALRRPLAGWGSGTVVAALRRERGTALPQARAAARTTPLAVAVEQGALGLAAWLALLWFAARRLLAGAGRSPARAGLGAALVALVVDALLHGALLEDPMTWAVLGAGSALAFADRRRRPRRRVPAEVAQPASEERVATPA